MLGGDTIKNIYTDIGVMKNMSVYLVSLHNVTFDIMFRTEDAAWHWIRHKTCWKDNNLKLCYHSKQDLSNQGFLVIEHKLVPTYGGLIC